MYFQSPQSKAVCLFYISVYEVILSDLGARKALWFYFQLQWHHCVECKSKTLTVFFNAYNLSLCQMLCIILRPLLFKSSNKDDVQKGSYICKRLSNRSVFSNSAMSHFPGSISAEREYRNMNLRFSSKNSTFRYKLHLAGTCSYKWFLLYCSM